MTLKTTRLGQYVCIDDDRGFSRFAKENLTSTHFLRSNLVSPSTWPYIIGPKSLTEWSKNE